jgi:hypothetical protein
MIKLNTVKGKGWNFDEGKVNNHHMIITKEQMAKDWKPCWRVFFNIVRK